MLSFTSVASSCLAASQELNPGRWAPANYKAMQTLIDIYGNKSPNYNPDKRPYAVFDWDNSSIMNDTEEALFAYQIQNLAFKLTPQEFGAIIRKNVPSLSVAFPKNLNNLAGQAVTFAAVAADLDNDYKFIYDNYAGMKGKMSLTDIQKTEQYLDFRAKMEYLFAGVNETSEVHLGYTWVLYFFKNMSTEEVQNLAEKSNDYALGQALAQVTWVSSKELPGEAGMVAIPHWSGIRVTDEQADLMNTLRANGIDVYICSASLEDVVAVFASNPKYGYNIPRENVIGMRLEKINNVFQDSYLHDWPLIAEHGKTVAIQNLIAAKRGYGPLLVSGDSDGDYNMMTEFPDTKRVILVNRIKTGLFGELCKQAVDTIGTDSPKYILQGRDENTGLWLPSEKMIKIGKTTAALLP
jgi:phosphoserine phosphatase